MRTLLLTAVLLLFPLAALSQQGTTGDVTGIVSAGDSPLAGVAITLTSSSLQGSLTSISGENGGYHFALLPPGAYALRFELQGLETTRQVVRVSLAQTTRADVSMTAASSESISVVADSFDTTQIARSFRNDLVETLPTGRPLRDIALLSTSVNPNGRRNRLLISGAPSWSSVFLVDGAVVNDNLGGQPHDLFVEDAIEETTVLTGALSPEYGLFTGGVVSVRTKSGGNTLAGSLRSSLRNTAWTARTPWPDESEPEDNLSAIHEATIGGAGVRDRLWFFAAARFADQSKQQTTIRTNIPYIAATDETRWEVKLTGQIGRGHNVVLSYLESLLNESNTVSVPAGVLNLDALTPARSSPGQFLTTSYHSMLPRNVFLEAQYSMKTYALRGNGGLSTDRLLGTVIGAPRTGNLNAPQGCGVCGDDERNNDSWLIKGTHYRQTRTGSHTLLAGFDSFREERVFNAHRSASNYVIQTARFQFNGQNAYPIFDSATVINWSPVLLPSDGTSFGTHSVFLNDRWDLSTRLGFNIGLRYDRNDTSDADGNLVSDDDAISPRLAAFFDPRGDGAHRFSIGYGRYVSKIPELPGLGSAAQRAGNPHSFAWRYRGPTINSGTGPLAQLVSPREALAQLFAWFDSVGGVNNREFLVNLSVPGLSTLIPESLHSPFVDEVTFGYAVRVGKAGHLRADAIARAWGGFYAARLDTTTGQREDPEGNPVDVSWIVNDDSETSRTYQAVQVQGTWEVRLLRVGGGYTWSKLRGNEDGESQGGEPATNRPLALWYPELLGYSQRRPVGYLTGDQRHRARVWVSYDIPFARDVLDLSLIQSYDSGRAYSVEGLIDSRGTMTPYPESPRNPAYALTQFASAGYPYFFSKRGALRTDDVWSTDVALNFHVPLARANVFVQYEVFNLFNQAAVTNPSTEVLTLARSGRSSGLSAFDPFATTPVEGVHYRLPPDFGKATGPSSYQPPRTHALSIGMKF
ncbi:MAG TPA: TonB-dependent receptor [Gemmatimonadaceae bacterium]|nr:TonB-dependent receptor [Gemmatimonadaceae bacterium]